MADEPNFVDLFALTKITSESVVERFGSSINSSFFDGSNILGGLRIKGLIDFTTTMGSQNSIVITDSGRKLLDDANKKAAEPIDQLDTTILLQLSNGKRTVNDISGVINISSKDLAVHLYKINAQNYASAEFRNGILNISLTEKGFMQINSKNEPSVTLNKPTNTGINTKESYAVENEAKHFNLEFIVIGVVIIVVIIAILLLFNLI